MELMMFFFSCITVVICILLSLKVHWFFGVAGVASGFIIGAWLINENTLVDTISGATMTASPYVWLLILLTLGQAIILVERGLHG